MSGPSTLQPIVRAVGIRKEFPGVVALDSVHVDLYPGEIHAVAGENGSGKSTLAKILYGELSPDQGTVFVDDAPVKLGSPGRARQHGVVAITQELTLAPSLTVTENILMGRLPSRAGFVGWRAARRIARRALDDLKIEIDERQIVSELSIELRQEVEIARALSAEPRVLILDEATSSLSALAAERLVSHLRRLRDRGTAILFISHRLSELYECANRATVLRDGRLVDVVQLPGTPESELIRRMVGRSIGELYGKPGPPPTDVALEVKGLSTEDASVRAAALSVRHGEIVGVAGLVGCGKAELALAIGGALSVSSGELCIDGTCYRPSSPRDAIQAGIVLVPEDRKQSGLFPSLSAERNLSIAWLDRFTRAGVINVPVEHRLAATAASRFRVRAPSLRAPITQLSGGNQQKVMLARWFSTSPSVVVLLEPTRGIDVGAKAEVYGLIRDAAASGTAILVISSELPELLGLCDRIFVMRGGELRAQFDARSVGEEEIARVALGGSDGTAE